MSQRNYLILHDLHRDTGACPRSFAIIPLNEVDASINSICFNARGSELTAKTDQLINSHCYQGIAPKCELFFARTLSKK